MGRVPRSATGGFDCLVSQSASGRTHRQMLQSGGLLADVHYRPVSRCHLQRHRPVHDVTIEVVDVIGSFLLQKMLWCRSCNSWQICIFLSQKCYSCHAAVLTASAVLTVLAILYVMILSFTVSCFICLCCSNYSILYCCFSCCSRLSQIWTIFSVFGEPDLFEIRSAGQVKF